MRPVKTLAAVLVAAIATMALLGASPASATTTVICKENVSACPEASQVVLKEIHLLATDPKLLTNLGTILCEYGLIKAEVLHFAAPLQVHLKELKYINCKLGNTSCIGTATSLGLPHLLKTASNLGEFSDAKNGEGLFTQAKFTCGESVNCEFKWESLVGHAVGSQTGEVAGSITYSEKALNKVSGGILCPSTTTLDAVYVDLHATELYIASPAATTNTTVICKENILACPEAQRVVLKDIHLLATDPKLLTSFGNVLCEYGLIKAEVLHLATPLQVHLKELEYSNCKLGAIACTVFATHFGLPSLLKTAPNLGEFSDSVVEGQYTQVIVECGESLSCEYKWESLIGHAIGSQEGGVAGNVSFSGKALKVAGGILCPKASTLDAIYVDLHTTELFISE